jgi:hypothetical protein
MASLVDPCCQLNAIFNFKLYLYMHNMSQMFCLKVSLYAS